MPNDFHPDPVLAGWNYNWLDGSDAWWRAIWDYRIFNVFADAVKERFEAMFPWLSVPAYCDHATSGDYSLTRWKALYNGFLTDFYPDFFAGSRNDADFLPPAGGGTLLGSASPGPNVLPLLRSATYGASLPRDFPVAYMVDLSPLKAYYPREITSTAATGTNGQFARFIGNASTPGNGTSFGQIFLRSGGAWLYHSARSTVTSTASFGFPDKVERAGVYDVEDPSFDGGAAVKLTSGDYFCPEWLAAFRDLLNETVVFWHDNNGEAAGTSDAAWDYLPFWSAEGANTQNAGSGVDEAATDADYNGGGNLAVVDRPAPFVDVQWGSDLMGGFVVVEKERWSAYPKVTTLPKPGVTRGLSVYIAPSVWLDTALSFEDFGDGVSDDAWERVGSGTTSAGSYLGSRFGTLATPPSAAKPADSAIAGYAVPTTIGAGVFSYTPTIGAVSRWDVPGGFAYTVDT